MSTKKKNPSDSKAKASAEGTPRRDRVIDDVGGVLLLLMAVLAALALVSFRPEGPNLVGPVGGFVADSVLFLLGLASFALVAVLAAWGVALLVGGRIFTRYREVVGYLLMFATAPAALHMAIDTTVLGHPAGGLLGGVAATLLAAAIGGFGAALVCATTLLVALMLVTDRSLGQLTRGMWKDLVAKFDESREAGRTRAAERSEAKATRAAEKAAKRAEKEAAKSAAKDADASADTAAEEAVGEVEASDETSEREPLFRRVASRFRRASSNVPTVSDDTPTLEDDASSLEGFSFGDEPAWALALSGESAPFDASDDADEVTASHIVGDEDAGPTVREPEVRRPAPPPAPKVPAAESTPAHEAPPAKATPASAAPPAPTGDDVEGPDIGPKIVESTAQRQRKRAEDLDRAQQVALPLDGDRATWTLPPLSFLNYEEAEDSAVDREKLRDLAARLEQVLVDFKVKGRVSGICPGPVVTLFEFEPESGTKLSRISGLSDDIAMALRAHKVRIIAPIPGKGCVGIEVPNEDRETVYLKEILADEVFTKAKSKLTMALGKDIEGFPVVMDLAKSPHLLVAGTTGSGKSVSVNAMITSVLYNASPDDVKMILIDPKQLEFAIYEGMPHLLLPVVTDPAKAATALNWAVQEMERRYKLMAELKVRNIKGYNEKLAKLHEGLADVDLDDEDHVPSPTELMLTRTDSDGRVSHRRMYHLVVVVDEFADLMMVAGKEVEVAVARLAQKARAAGIHCILATQRPSVDVITGLIKANFPTRISFRLMSGTDSRTVLDTVGSENLLGMGDMLYRPPGTSELKRVHGAFVDESEIEQVVAHLAEQRAPEYDESILAAPEGGDAGDSDEPVDELYDQAVSVVIEEGYASISMVQRKLRIGYNRSARIIEEMERQGLVGPTSGGSSRREVLAGGAHVTM